MTCARGSHWRSRAPVIHSLIITKIRITSEKNLYFNYWKYFTFRQFPIEHYVHSIPLRRKFLLWAKQQQQNIEAKVALARCFSIHQRGSRTVLLYSKEKNFRHSLQTLNYLCNINKLKRNYKICNTVCNIVENAACCSSSINKKSL